MKIVCAANPKSQSGTVRRFFPAITSAVEATGSSCELLDLTAGDFVEKLQAQILTGADVVMGIGGDGTHHSVVNTLKRLEAEKGLKLPSYAFCPLGTGNDIAKSLHVRYGSHHFPDVADTAAKGVDQLLDLGNYENGYFLDMLSLGTDVAILADREILTTALRKRPALNQIVHGYVIYAIATLRGVLRPQRWTGTIGLDGQEWFRGRFSGILVNNCDVHAGEFTLTPGARMDDGLLDVLLIPSMPRYVLHYLRGWRFHPDFIRRYQSRHLAQAKIIELSLEQAAPLQVDGELREPVSKLKIEVCPQALRVKVPG